LSDITKRYQQLIRRCAQCGTCTASCPTSEFSDFNIRKLVRYLQLDLHEDEEFLSSYPWLCTLCYRCKEQCTEGLAIPNLVWALREMAIEKGASPKEAKVLLDTTKSDESPYILKGRSKTARIKPPIESKEDSNTLFWMGCTPSIKVPDIVSSTANVLNKMDHGFKILSKEPCCAEPLICLGYMDEVKEIAKGIVNTISESGVSEIIAPCSGCYNAFKHLYPERLGVEFEGIEILHSSQYLAKNIKDLKLENPLTVTYHDPCTLGRHAGIYKEPRKVLESIEGLTFLELDKNREFTTCCGGGGGLPSLNSEMAMDVAAAKIKREILPMEVDALVTSCPMCVMNFKYASIKKKIPVKVHDLSEIVSMCVLQ
jgi:Fe-S oxidoreductase